MLVRKIECQSFTAACIVVQAYKQAKERPDLNLNPFLVDPGWVKTGKVLGSEIQHILTWSPRYGRR